MQAVHLSYGSFHWLPDSYRCPRYVQGFPPLAEFRLELVLSSPHGSSWHRGQQSPGFRIGFVHVSGGHSIAQQSISPYWKQKHNIMYGTQIGNLTKLHIYSSSRCVIADLLCCKSSPDIKVWCNWLWIYTNCSEESWDNFVETTYFSVSLKKNVTFLPSHDQSTKPKN